MSQGRHLDIGLYLNFDLLVSHRGKTRSTLLSKRGRSNSLQSPEKHSHGVIGETQFFHDSAKHAYRRNFRFVQIKTLKNLIGTKWQLLEYRRRVNGWDFGKKRDKLVSIHNFIKLLLLLFTLNNQWSERVWKQNDIVRGKDGRFLELFPL